MPNSPKDITVTNIFTTSTTCYGAGTDRTVTELKTDITELLRTLVRGSAKALVLYI